MIIWFRRDLRIADHPALLAAIAAAVARDEPVTPLYVLDPQLLRTAGPNRVAFLLRSLHALRELGVPLVTRVGDPRRIVPEVAAGTGAGTVWCTTCFTPYGRRRDARVADALHATGRSLERVGSPYAVAPGVVVTKTGTGFRVFTPFHRAWLEHARELGPFPTVEPATVRWRDDVRGDRLPAEPDGVAPGIPVAGPVAAAARWHRFRTEHLDPYATDRDLPGVDGSSRLSVDLKFGALHPRRLLVDLRDATPGSGAWVFRSELAWREFYADVLWRAPRSSWSDLDPSMTTMRTDTGPEADDRFAAWCAGRTGYPFVDAGMRQLLAEGWMHNRARMVTASFLVKDLHLPWQRGAQWFLQHLVDGDIASNQHGWQWTAGTGTDAAPYFRVFNPTTQGRRFDPEGAYVRRFVAELRDHAGDVHAPHAPPTARRGADPGVGLFEDLAYPRPVVDHAAERVEALHRYAQTRPPPP